MAKITSTNPLLPSQSGRNETACQLLGNLCVLQLYAPSDPACEQSVLLAGNTLPSLYYPQRGADEALERNDLVTRLLTRQGTDVRSHSLSLYRSFSLSIYIYISLLLSLSLTPSHHRGHQHFHWWWLHFLSMVVLLEYTTSLMTSLMTSSFAKIDHQGLLQLGMWVYTM